MLQTPVLDELLGLGDRGLAIPHVDPGDQLARTDRAAALDAERDDSSLGLGLDLDDAVRLDAPADDDLAHDRRGLRERDRDRQRSLVVERLAACGRCVPSLERPAAI